MRNEGAKYLACWAGLTGGGFIYQAVFGGGLWESAVVQGWHYATALGTMYWLWRGRL